MIESVQANIVINSIVAWLVDWMERSRLPVFMWISKNTPAVTKIMFALAAAIHSAGVAWTFNAGVLTISGLHLYAITHFFVATGYNYVLQHFVYKTVIASRRRTSDVIQDESAVVVAPGMVLQPGAVVIPKDAIEPPKP